MQAPPSAAKGRLVIRLDHASGVPVYRQIIDQVLAAVAAGQLRPRDQLPTVRQLAVDLSVNANTVLRAYRELEIRGLVATQQGMGTFISEKKVERDEAERQRSLDQLVADTVARAGREGFTIRDLIQRLEDWANEAGQQRR